jgi:hypothetical protein
MKLPKGVRLIEEQLYKHITIHCTYSKVLEINDLLKEGGWKRTSYLPHHNDNELAVIRAERIVRKL